MKTGLLFIVACMAFAWPVSRREQQKIEPDRTSLERGRVESGRQRFLQVCSGCHGATGEGGQGPKLVENWHVRIASKETLFGYIRNGVPGSMMPPFPLSDDQIWDLVAFVRGLNEPAISVPVQGDVQTGRAIFFGKGGCTSCHMIRGQGGFLGPDLSDIGATRRLDQLRNALLKPNDEVSQDFRPVIFITSDGRSIEGVAKHYSNYSIQILDKDGALHLLRRGDLRRIVFREKSWMPDDYAQRLTLTEVENLLAFLSQQSIRPPSKSEETPASPSPVLAPEPEPNKPDLINQLSESFRAPAGGG